MLLTAVFNVSFNFSICSLKFMEIIFTSEKRKFLHCRKHHVTITKTNPLILFRELFALPYNAYEYTVLAKCKFC